MNTKEIVLTEKSVINVDPQVCAAHFSGCGKFLVAGSFDGRVRRWDVTDGEPQELDAFEDHNAWVGPVVTSESLAYSADSWGRIAAWRYEDDSPESIWTHKEAHDGWCRHLAIGNNVLASCGRDPLIKLWDAQSGDSLGQLDSHAEDIYCLAIHPTDPNILVSGDAKGSVRAWDLAQQKCIREFDASLLFMLHRLQDVGGVKCLAFNGAGDRLAVGGTKPKNGATVQGEPTVLVFDFDSGKLQSTMHLGPTKDCFVHEIHWHQDGYIMAVTSGTPGSGRLLFQEIDAEEPLYSSKKLMNCHSLSLSPSGDQLAVTTTNRNSNGNGRRLNKEGNYEGNITPIHLLAFPL